MPLINGQKMACEPCIRGHRSTKCTHANERLMVPVRKPGRPLSSCPHPASRPCSCAAVTAAIPKKQRCSCGTSETSSSSASSSSSSCVAKKTEKEGSSAGSTPSSTPKTTTTTTATTTTTSSAYRVQKSTAKSGSARKAIDPAGLERMDASQLNILPPLDAGNQQTSTPTPNGMAAAMSSIPGFGALGFMPTGSAFNHEPTMFPIFQQHMSSPMLNHPVLPKPAANGTYSPQMNGVPGSSAASTSGSCCGGGKAARNQQTPNTNGVKGHKPKSCCSSGAGSPEETSQEELMPGPDVHAQTNGIMMPAFQAAPHVIPSGMFPYFQQPTVFAYPPQYGTYLQPLQPEQWKQLMATLAYMNPIPSAVYGVPAAVQFPQSIAVDGASWTSHQCACGDSCQCVGCATHPYNQATQDYVRSAWNSMMEDAQKQQQHSLTNGNSSMSGNQTPNGMATPPVMSQNEGTVSPTAAHTPSDAASGIGEEQTLSANDFLFVSYTLEDSCDGEMASCPCGDDCQCIGCVIHNSPGLLEPTAEEC